MSPGRGATQMRGMQGMQRMQTPVIRGAQQPVRRGRGATSQMTGSNYIIYTGCGTLTVPCLFLCLEILNIILSIWEFNQFLYMILVVLSQNFIVMG